MKKLKVIALTVLIITVILSPIIFVVSAIALTPKSYSNTIYGELDDKFERLNSVEGEKLVVIGGSSVAFGLNSAVLEDIVGMPVVNFGLYAAVGTKAMLELSLSAVGEGDIIVLAPELDSQTMSNYFSSEHILPAIDENYSMAKYFEKDEKLMLLGGSFAHAVNKLKLKGEIPNPKGIYNSNNFDEYGEIKAGLREGNVMQFYYDPEKMIELSENIVSEDFLDYLNGYIEECESRGATVYFSYCPMNEAALSEGTTDADIRKFEKYLEDNIRCEFISNINDYILDKAYFYDTNYHLNDIGALLRTKLLAQDILIAEDIPRLIDTEISPPPLPEIDVKYLGENDPNSEYFILEKAENGAYMIVGLTEAGKRMKTLTVPLGYEGYKVTALGRGALAGGAVTKLIVTEDTNLRNILDGAFSGSAVTDIYIYYDFDKESEKLAPCADFGGGMRVHVKNGSAFTTHYDWLDSSGGYYFVTDID